MADQAILLVHGMGTYAGPTGEEPGSFGKEFIDATTESLQAFTNHSSDILSQHVDIHEFNYDDWLNTMRQIMADNGIKMKDRLALVGDHYGVSAPLNLAGKLLAFEADYGKDEFFYTHWLDVIFYASMLGAKIRVDAGLKVADLVQQYGAGNVHIIPHSLGTAVVHDTLDRLYRPESDPNDGIPDLHPSNNRLGSIWMFANVSRLVNSVTKFADPYTSIVRPGNHGCTNSFVNIRHELDPFTWLARFDPSDNGQWLDQSTYSIAYDNEVTRLVVDGNTHSFKQYLQDPKVISKLLYRLHPALDVSVDEFNQVKAEYEKKSINGAYAALEESFSRFELKDVATWQSFLETAKALKDIAEKITNDLA